VSSHGSAAAARNLHRTIDGAFHWPMPVKRTEIARTARWVIDNELGAHLEIALPARRHTGC
jgi:hypothetical protein